MSVFNNIRTMHNKFNFIPADKPQILPPLLQQFRIDFIQEEMDELVEATHNKDIEEIIDALIDIMVVAAGTLDLMGCDSQAHWDEVHHCNMRKVHASIDNKSKRGLVDMDLVKPAGWTGPDHRRILDE